MITFFRKLFWDEIEIDYLFDNNFHMKWWTTNSWEKKSLSDQEIWERKTKWLETKNYTSAMRMRRNGIEVTTN